MSNLPKNPKPHIGESKNIEVPNISSSDRKKVLSEMTELIRENKKIIAKYNPSHNETFYE